MAEQLVTLLAVAAGFVLVIVSLALPRLVKRRMSDNEPTLLGNTSDEDLRALERIEDSTLQLEEMSRELFARLDTRVRVMSRLIEEAEIRARELQVLLESEGRDQ